eukprot:2723056-Rhodomonas_salina.1
MVMDYCYDNTIRQLVEELENKIFAGDSSSAEQGGFVPYKRFSKDGAELIASCRQVIDKAVTQLQVQVRSEAVRAQRRRAGVLTSLRACACVRVAAG